MFPLSLPTPIGILLPPTRRSASSLTSSHDDEAATTQRYIVNPQLECHICMHWRGTWREIVAITMRRSFVSFSLARTKSKFSEGRSSTLELYSALICIVYLRCSLPWRCERCRPLKQKITILLVL